VATKQEERICINTKQEEKISIYIFFFSLAPPLSARVSSLAAIRGGELVLPLWPSYRPLSLSELAYLSDAPSSLDDFFFPFPSSSPLPPPLVPSCFCFFLYLLLLFFFFFCLFMYTLWVMLLGFRLNFPHHLSVPPISSACSAAHHPLLCLSSRLHRNELLMPLPFLVSGKHVIGSSFRLLSSSWCAFYIVYFPVILFGFPPSSSSFFFFFNLVLFPCNHFFFCL
jgi:hypothetical protein